MTDTAYIDSLQSREDMYRLLGRVFYKEVDTPMLTALQGVTFPSATGNTDFDQGVALFNQAVATLATQSNRDNVDADYARTFLGAGVAGNTSAFPFESVYTSAAHLVAQDAFEEVSLIFRKAGFQKTDADLFEDHVALEFAYMAELCHQGVCYATAGNFAALESNLKTQAEFFEKHLHNWIPRFCADILAVSSQDLYKAAALLTQGFMQMELDNLEQSAA